MRIGMFTDYYLPIHTGVSTSVAGFREELEKLGHEVYIFAPAEGMKVREEDDHIIRYPAIKGLFVENYMTSVFFPPQEVRKIEKLNLDIIHFHTPSQIGLLGVHVALKNDIPLVATYHTDLRQYAKTYPTIGRWSAVLALLAPLVTRGGIKDAQVIRPQFDREAMNEQAVEKSTTLIHNYCDLVIVPSQKMKRQLVRWQTTAPIEILPTGVDKITTTSAEVAACKAKYGITPDDRVVIFSGRLGKEKNVELLVKAFAKAYEKMPSLKLVLVGDFKHSEELLDLATELGISDRLIKTGWVENHKLGAVLGCANLFALPSLTDTQALVLNEAAHASLPLLAVDPLINDVLQDGVNGLITKPTISAFAQGILTILSDKKKTTAMGKASAEQAKKFGETIQAKKLVTLYKTAIEEHAKL